MKIVVSAVLMLVPFLACGDLDVDEIILYPVSPMERIIDNQPPSEADARRKAGGASLSIFAAPGQYEPATFIVYPIGQTLQNVSVKVSDLRTRDEKRVIPSTSVSCYVLKNIYVGQPQGIMGGNIDSVVYWPELLLKDESIIKADHEKKTNVAVFEGDLPLIPDRIQPFTIAEDEIKQIWLTVHVPEDTGAGLYSGDVTVSAGNTSETIKLELEVLDITLARAQADMGVYMQQALWDAETEYYRLMVRNMARHGVNFAYIASPRVEERHLQESDFEELKKYIDIWKEEGVLMRRAMLPATELTRYLWWAAGQKNLSDEWKEKVRKESENLVAFLRSYDPNIEWYIYGMDERDADTRVQKIYEETGLKVLNASNTADPHLHYNLYYTYVWFPHRGVQELMRLGREHGHYVGYYTPMSRWSDPVLYRYKAGFNLWNKAGEGYIPWSYLHGRDRARWEFDLHDRHSTLDFVRPAENGLVNTVAWEGYREGTDDLRYISTLALMVEKADQLDIKDTMISKAEQLLGMISIQPYNVTQQINYTDASKADYTPFSEAFPWQRLDEARREIVELIVEIQQEHPELHSSLLSQDMDMIRRAEERRVREFDIDLLEEATARRNDMIAKFREAYEAHDRERAGKLARELKKMHEERSRAWERAGFVFHEMPEKDKIEEAIDKSGD